MKLIFEKMRVKFFRTDLNGVLALGQGVPQLDGLVPGSGDDLPVVGRESDGHNVLGVVLEPAQGEQNKKMVYLL